MKRTMFLLTTLLFAVPALAEVAVTCSPGGVLSYDATSEGGAKVRAFALEITVDPEVNITGISGLNTEYDIYPGTIKIVDGNVIEVGTPIASPNAPDNPGQIGSSSIIVGMGSLYDPDIEQGPPAIGDLLTISVSAECNVTITTNTLRGGVVMEGGTVAEVNAPGAVITGGPACWNWDCQPYGDADGDGFLTASDVQVLITAWSGDYNPCCDFDHDGFITSSDVQTMLVYWSTGCP